ncbi:MAG: TIGR00289 family protein [Candidatus Altiarchaeales archaeon HGW-Altiarchaeales-1]|nr:MAG: TIGR00289 family protein [Candidatus Altiarchaeales archaeon HGW-Altiarchaeales-1]
MKLVSLFSGGKDSTIATYKAINANNEIVALLSFVPDKESYMFHYPNIKFAKISAEAMNIPIIMEESDKDKEKEIDDLKREIKILKDKCAIEGVCVGAVSSNYQYSRVKKICDELNLEVYAPYWKKSHEDLIREAINLNFKILIVGVYADGFDESWLGRELDLKALEDLKKLENKFHINIGGEGGEYETFVTDCPLFKKRLVIDEAEKIWDNIRGEFLIKKVRLVDKF